VLQNQCSQQLWRLRLLVERPRRPAFVLMTGPLPDGYPSLRASHGPQEAYRDQMTPSAVTRTVEA